jgi:DNA-directed RNA polymerase subunit RPC12/RpoP
MSAGQSSRATNGAGPVKILRPGDPGFPKYEDAPAQTRKTCQHPGCTTVFEPSAAQRKYCADHGTKQAEQARYLIKKGAAPAARKPEASKTRRCFQCGKDYVPTGNAQRTCPDCKSKAIPPTKPKTLKDIVVGKAEVEPTRDLPDRAADPFSEQVGGDHYKALAIQPIEYCQRNGLSYCEANVVKYVTRHRFKGGSQDILKAIHNLQLLLKMEYPQG